VTLPGADSASPKPAQYFRRKVWGVYVAGATFHIWTHAEVLELRRYGVEGVMPIVVPPQDHEWWLENSGYATLEALVREAKAWGVPEGSPLCLDIERNQSDRMLAKSDVAHAWAVATRTHKYRTWTYGAWDYLVNDPYGFRWVAVWPNPTPSNPTMPRGCNAWQYANRPGEGIDLDIFEYDRDYMTPERGVTIPREPSIKSHSEPVLHSIEPASGSSGRKVPLTAGGGVDVSGSPPPTIAQGYL